MSGLKFDEGKPDLSLIPYVALVHEALAFMDGEKKYGRYNYLKGFETSRLVSAALRHVLAYMAGENTAADSQVHHLGHARACLAMLLHLEQEGKLSDNRPKNSVLCPPGSKARIKRDMWLNVYQPSGHHRGVIAYDSKEAADRNAAPERVACIRVEINYEEGEGL